VSAITICFSRSLNMECMEKTLSTWVDDKKTMLHSFFIFSVMHYSIYAVYEVAVIGIMIFPIPRLFCNFLLEFNV
jgi:hypothetical protein